MGNYQRCLQVGAFIASILCHGALGQVCNFAGEGLLITKPSDADALRNCREVNGHVVIAPENTANIDLSGPETIRGNITGTEESMRRGASLNISSTTLTTVDGYLSITGYGNASIQNISFPRLSTVADEFSLWNLHKLVYVDVTNLHTVGAFEIWAESLSTLKHKELRKVESVRQQRKSIRISQTSLESVDSIFNNNIKVSRASLYATSNLKRVVVGFNESGELNLSGTSKTDQFEVILGGESTTSMHIDSIRLSEGVSSIQRSPSLQNLTANEFITYGNSYTHLHLPFEQLGTLSLSVEKSLKWISVPPQASQWANFTLHIDRTTINLSSEYMVDEKGEMVRSWYWPERDMFSIYITGSNMTPAFFDSFIRYQNATVNTTSQPKVLHEFRLSPDNQKTFDCRPFEQLARQGNLNGFYCYGEVGRGSSAYSWRRTSVTSTTWSAAIIATAMYLMIM